MPTQSTVATVLCVDDNEDVARALQSKLGRTEGLAWGGWLFNADGLVEYVERHRPALVLLDIDMPGLNPFEALEKLTERCPEARAIMFSGHVRADLIDRAVEAGAWGYVSKNDGEEALIGALRGVLAGEFSLSAEARRSYLG